MAEEVEALARDLKQQDALIEPHVIDAGLAEEYETVRRSQSLVTRMRTRLRRMIERASPKECSVVDSDALSSSERPRNSGHLRLPKVELQKFNGNKLEWQPFWEQYKQAIHENNSLSSVEKFLYLRMSLTGKAAAVVSGLQATEDNYSSAVDMLKERFGRQDILVQEHLTQLLNLPQVKALNDVAALRRLHDHVQKNTGALKTLGVGSEGYGTMLCAALFRVMPEEWAVEYHKQKSASKGVLDSSTLSDILRSIRLELESREKACQRNSQAQTPPANQRDDKHPSSDYGRRGKGSAAALQSGVRNAVLLQTARVWVDGRDRKRLARCLLDGGSQRSFVTEGLSRELKLEVVGEEEVTIYPFGGTQNVTKKKRRVVRVWLRSQYSRKEHSVDALEIEDICSDHLALPDSVVQTIVVTQQNPNLSTELRAFWELESLGITETNCGRGGENEKVREDFISSLAFIDGRYEAGLPWKPLNRQLETNETVARQRLLKLTRPLGSNTDRLVQYDEALREYIEKGYAERVPESEVEVSSRPVYYMPHRAVYRPDSSTTKIRIVFDASAKAQGSLSLNDALSTGPNLNPDLLQLILNFRCHVIALTADIEKALVQIGIKPDDRDALRFLWYADPPTDDAKDPDIVGWRMTRVPFGATCSPFMLAATIKHHLSTVAGDLCDTVRVLEGCLYVDDLITGADTLERVTKFYQEAQHILSSAGMKLRKWSSNSEIMQQKFHRDGVGNPSSETEASASPVTRVLGLEWNRSNDALKFCLGTTLELLTINRNTKRFILQVSARIFDPFGLLGPVTIIVKMLFQKLWTLGLDWDAPLPRDLSDSWSQWVEALHHLEEISIPRRYVCHAEGNELHIFTDASPQAYGAVAYLRSQRDGETTVTLVMAKSRVAPLKALSLPRLELLGVLLGARICDYLKRVLALSLSRLNLWTDSMIAFHWIRGSASRWKPFVANRVMEIQEKTAPSDWRHCPGNENPADMLTRGVAPEKLKDCESWWTGPTWLAQPASSWPKTPTGSPTEVPEEERRSAALPVGHAKTVATHQLVPIDRYSSLSRLLRVTAWLRRFVNNCNPKAEKRMGPLSAKELRESRLLLLRQVQEEAFGSMIGRLEHEGTSDQATALRNVEVFRDDDEVLRLKGRLLHSEIPYETAHPIVLPAAHHFVELLIASTHQRLLHAGCQDVLTQLREAYWIIRARQAVKKVLGRCITCRRMHSRRATEPTAPLPRDRVSEAAPFEVTGIDFAGPVLTKSDGKTQKSYILLLTYVEEEGGSGVSGRERGADAVVKDRPSLSADRM
ncbi:uncharacterized protein LOC144168258 [Haemaphysalis longicornis]